VRVALGYVPPVVVPGVPEKPHLDWPKWDGDLSVVDVQKAIVDSWP